MKTQMINLRTAMVQPNAEYLQVKSSKCLVMTFFHVTFAHILHVRYLKGGLFAQFFEGRTTFS